jgi:hypothetical protein
MTEEDARVIKAARFRQAQGNATALDRWRLQVAEQRTAEWQARPVERGFTEAESREWNEWVQQHRDREWEERVWPNIDDVIKATADVFDELRAENEKLRLELAELRGEIRGMRGAPHSASRLISK